MGGAARVRWVVGRWVIQSGWLVSGREAADGGEVGPAGWADWCRLPNEAPPERSGQIDSNRLSSDP